MGDVVVYLVVGERLEGDVGGDGEALLALKGGQCDSGDDLMGLTAQRTKHTAGIGLVVGLAHDLGAEDDDGVGGDDQFVGSHLREIGRCLLVRDIFGNLGGGQVGRIALVDALDDAHLEIDAQSAQQLLAARRVGSQYDMIRSDYHPNALSSFSHLPWARSVCSITSRPQPCPPCC